MRQTFLPFTRPSITETEIQEVTETLRSGGSPQDPVWRLSKEFSRYVSAPFGMPPSPPAPAGVPHSPSSAGHWTGDEVITPSLTWLSPWNMMELVGAGLFLPTSTARHSSSILQRRTGRYAADESHRSGSLCGQPWTWSIPRLSAKSTNSF